MKFAHVRDGVVVQFLEELPHAFYGITRFRSLSSEERAAHGVVPVLDVTPAFDPALYELAGVAAAAVFADRVEVTYRLRRAGPVAAALEAGGPARTERRIRRLAATDPIEALLVIGGLK